MVQVTAFHHNKSMIKHEQNFSPQTELKKFGFGIPSSAKVLKMSEQCYFTNCNSGRLIPCLHIQIPSRPQTTTKKKHVVKDHSTFPANDPAEDCKLSGADSTPAAPNKKAPLVPLSWGRGIRGETPPNQSLRIASPEPPSASASLSHPMGEGRGEGPVHGEGAGCAAETRVPGYGRGRQHQDFFHSTQLNSSFIFPWIFYPHPHSYAERTQL